MGSPIPPPHEIVRETVIDGKVTEREVLRTAGTAVPEVKKGWVPRRGGRGGGGGGPNVDPGGGGGAEGVVWTLVPGSTAMFEVAATAPNELADGPVKMQVGDRRSGVRPPALSCSFGRKSWRCFGVRFRSLPDERPRAPVFCFSTRTSSCLFFSTRGSFLSFYLSPRRRAWIAPCHRLCYSWFASGLTKVLSCRNCRPTNPPPPPCAVQPIVNAALAGVGPAALHPRGDGPDRRHLYRRTRRHFLPRTPRCAGGETRQGARHVLRQRRSLRCCRCREKRRERRTTRSPPGWRGGGTSDGGGACNGKTGEDPAGDVGVGGRGGGSSGGGGSGGARGGSAGERVPRKNGGLARLAPLHGDVAGSRGRDGLERRTRESHLDAERLTRGFRGGHGCDGGGERVSNRRRRVARRRCGGEGWKACLVGRGLWIACQGFGCCCAEEDAAECQSGCFARRHLARFLCTQPSPPLPTLCARGKSIFVSSTSTCTCIRRL